MGVLIGTWPFAAGAIEAARARGGGSLEEVIAAAETVEADPAVDSVGYGGLPDAEGEVSLDACVMLSPREIGSVCALRRHPQAARIARAVMERTAHVMLAGEGADRFAESVGVCEGPMLSPKAREAWKAWRVARGQAAGGHDTVSVLGLDDRGRLAGVCTTSGMRFKLSGRVGDSPIPGHGLYVDPVVGAVAATGTGELIMGVCGSFLAVERMRMGARPLDALLEVLRRIQSGGPLAPEAQAAFIALTREGEVASAALRPGFQAAIADGGPVRVCDPDAVLLAH